MQDARLEFSDLVRESVTAHGNSGDEGMSRAASDIWMKGFDDFHAKRAQPAERSESQSSTMTVPLAVLASALPATQVGLLAFAANQHERRFNRA